MASRKRSAKVPPAHVAAAELSTWLVSFEGERESSDTHDRDEEVRFDILVRATSARRAVAACKKRIQQLRRETTLFEDGCKIYLEHFIRLPSELEKPALINYSTVSSFPLPDGVIGRGGISCVLPEQSDIDLDIYDAKDADDEGTYERKVFLEFV